MYCISVLLEQCTLTINRSIAADSCEQSLSLFGMTSYTRPPARPTKRYLQAFAIPGTIFMNVLSGALLGLKLGFALCQLHNTAGALLLYAQSKWLGKRLVQRYVVESNALSRRHFTMDNGHTLARIGSNPWQNQSHVTRSNATLRASSYGMLTCAQIL